MSDSTLVKRQKSCVGLGDLPTATLSNIFGGLHFIFFAKCRVVCRRFNTTLAAWSSFLARSHRGFRALQQLAERGALRKLCSFTVSVDFTIELRDLRLQELTIYVPHRVKNVCPQIPLSECIEVMAAQAESSSKIERFELTNLHLCGNLRELHLAPVTTAQVEQYCSVLSSSLETVFFSLLDCQALTLPRMPHLRYLGLNQRKSGVRKEKRRLVVQGLEKHSTLSRLFLSDVVPAMFATTATCFPALLVLHLDLAKRVTVAAFLSSVSGCAELREIELTEPAFNATERIEGLGLPCLSLSLINCNEAETLAFVVMVPNLLVLSIRGAFTLTQHVVRNVASLSKLVTLALDKVFLVACDLSPMRAVRIHDTTTVRAMIADVNHALDMPYVALDERESALTRLDLIDKFVPVLRGLLEKRAMLRFDLRSMLPMPWI